MTKEKDFYDFWAEGQGIPEEALDKWRTGPIHRFHCVFDGCHGTKEEFSVLIFRDNDTLICPECHGYKGIEPCIPDHCDWGESYKEIYPIISIDPKTKLPREGHWEGKYGRPKVLEAGK